MEPTVCGEVPKLADMVMCGDHPSVTKTEMNAKEVKTGDMNDKEQPKERTSMSYARISPTTSRTDRERAISDHALRLSEARRRRSLDIVPRVDVGLTSPPNRALLQAALGSFRWPPYLLAVWVLVLLVTHALHCLVGLLERTLPSLKKFCQYFRAWTEQAWKDEEEGNGRLARAGLACLTGLLYAVYYGLSLVYYVALWTIEPLCEDKAEEPRLTDYGDANNKSCSSIKH